MRELAQRGERVIYFSTERFAEAVRTTGVEFRPYSPLFTMPEQGPGPFARVSTTLEKLLNVSHAVLDHHLPEVRALSPTHIMFDSFAPWGNFVAEILQIPSIASVPSILINAEVDARYAPPPDQRPADPSLTREWYADFQARCVKLARYGLTPPMPCELLQSYGDLSLVYTSREFQPLAEAFDAQRFRFVGPSIGFRPQPPAFPCDWFDGRPRVLISLGTVYGNAEFLRRCLDELAGTSWQIVMSTGGIGPADFSPWPDNFIVQAQVPQLALLPRCAAFLTHAGMNSVQEALYFGVPLVMAPQAADQFWISARAAELGAGVVLDAPNTNPWGIRQAVANVLNDPSYAAAAAKLGESLRATGGQARAADEIQSFISCCPAA